MKFQLYTTLLHAQLSGSGVAGAELGASSSSVTYMLGIPVYQDKGTY